MYTDALKGSLNPKLIIDMIIYRFKFAQEHPHWFDPCGLTVFCGAQGRGKTLSAVKYIIKLLEIFPHAKLVSNVDIKGFELLDWEIERLKYKEEFEKNNEDNLLAIWDEQAAFDIFVKENKAFWFKNNDDFRLYENGDEGVIFLVDEISLYLNSLESKNINIELITEIAQQRKQRKHIVSTTQVFGRMAKPLREQFDTIVSCNNYLKFFQVNRLIDRDCIDDDNSTGTSIKGKVKKTIVWFHDVKDYGLYDTYAKIQRTKFQGGKGDIYGRLSANN